MPTKNINQKLICHVDDRGKFVEMLKTSNAGQISYFTIKPGIIRGSHYHHTKTEKFLVVHGKAIMSFRNIFSNKTFNLSLDSSIPEVVDTIPGWIHDIKNIGKDDAIVLVWANEEFDKSKPDTIGKKCYTSKLKVITIVGTRPEIIRLSRIIVKLEKYFRHHLIHTGQNYDYELNEIFFDDLNLKQPDFFLKAVGKTTMETIGKILHKSELILKRLNPMQF